MSLDFIFLLDCTGGKEAEGKWERRRVDEGPPLRIIFHSGVKNKLNKSMFSNGLVLDL